MGWSGGTFTRDTGVFTGSTAWKQTDDAGEGILSTRHDDHDQDMADGINATLKKDGGNTPSANLPMSGFRHTNTDKASSASDYARADQVQGNELAWGGAASGTDTLTLSLTPSLSSYTTGMVVWFQAANNNTGAVTMNVDSVGAKTVQKNGSALVADDIVSGRQYGLLYDGTNFQIFSLGLASTVGAGDIDTNELADEAVTYAKMQHVSATSRVLGRKTASAGDVEECTLSEVLDFIGSAAEGDILYRGASSWARLAKGSDDEVLTLASGVPSWAAAGSGVSASSYSASGYVQFSDGLVIQWGLSGDLAGTGGSVSFPLTFPTACFAAIIVSDESSARISHVESVSTSSFDAQFYDDAGSGATGSGYWIAVGH